ncbi:MAG TPA: nicotinate-nucleotide adenylyltransferase [Anaerolineae bacterium]
MARIGVLGGTFDPPHNGHLAIAQAALTQLQLAEVLFAPTHQPPHKLGNAITPIEHRLAMVRLAIAPHPRLTLSRVDVDRAGPTFTVDTMRLLRQQFANAELYFIMGTDSLANILTWRAPAEFIRLCRLAVFNRPGFTVDLDALEAQLPGLRERAVILPAPALDIAASDLQHRVRAGLPITDWVPAAVAAYIAEHGLYRDEGACCARGARG